MKNDINSNEISNRIKQKSLIRRNQNDNLELTKTISFNIDNTLLCSNVSNNNLNLEAESESNSKSIIKSSYDYLISKESWTYEEDNLLFSLRSLPNKLTWNQISSYFKDKNPNQCQYRYKKHISKSNKECIHINSNTQSNSIDSIKKLNININRSNDSFTNTNTIKSNLNLNDQITINDNNNDNNNINTVKPKTCVSLLKKYFPNKLINDLQDKINKKKNHKFYSFTPFDDYAIIKFYIDPNKITEMDLNRIRSKEKEEVKKRLKLLLKLKGESILKLSNSMNNNSFLMNDFSSFDHNIDNLNKFESILSISSSKSCDNLTQTTETFICRKRSNIDYNDQESILRFTYPNSNYFHLFQSSNLNNMKSYDTNSCCHSLFSFSSKNISNLNLHLNNNKNDNDNDNDNDIFFNKKYIHYETIEKD